MKTICGLAAALALLIPATPAAAQTNYPDRPVRIIVGFLAAGPADISARVVGDKLSQAWGQPVVIENVPGAGSNLAGERVAKSAPDGYTLLLGTNLQIAANPSLYGKMSYEPLKDLAPIS